MVAAAIAAAGCATGSDERIAAAADLPPGVTSLGSIEVAGSERYRFDSAIVGKTYVIEVVRIQSPLAPPPPDALLPVVFVTDNDIRENLVPALAQASMLETLPPMIVVGIGYGILSEPTIADAILVQSTRRSTDFTPTDDPAYRAGMAGYLQQRNLTWPDETPLGGADAFLAFVDDELKPFIASRYPADVEDATLIGHSLGGLFVMHALFTSPESFDRYIAISPFVSYDRDLVFREEAALGDVSARLYMAVGELDVPEILEATPRLDAQLRTGDRPSLRYTYEFFPGETHGSIVPVGMINGLRAVFDPPPPPSSLGPPPPPQDAER